MTKKDELIKVAQERVRSGGYSNFSFREIAAEVGIKSASVHYHFPTKEDMGAELARQYTDNFLAALGDPEAILQSGGNPIEVYIGLFRESLIKDQKMCLCGLLGAETDALPEKVRAETKRFFEQNIAWLEKAWAGKNIGSGADSQKKALETISILEGAMLVSKTLGNPDVFELAVDSLSA